MNRFLKNEWAKTEIPEEAYLQARNRAWARLQTRRPAVRPRVLWAAAVSLLAVTAILLLRPPKPAQIEINARIRQPEQPKAGSQVPAVTRNQFPSQQPAEDHHRITSPRASLRSQSSNRSAPKTAVSGVPDRVVLNFVLPETGVQMIWISDKNFRLDGANE